jgi:hypothetical protein
MKKMISLGSKNHMLYLARNFFEKMENSCADAFDPDVGSGDPRLSSDIKHVLDCLSKTPIWYSYPSVLVMDYTSFIAIMRSYNIYKEST